MNQKNDQPSKALWDFREYMFMDVIPIEEVDDLNGEPILSILPFWRKNGLVPMLAKNQKVFNVSFAEVIWFRILGTLREFGYPISKMRMVTDYFFKDAYDNNLPKLNLQKNKQTLQKKQRAGTLTDEDQRILSRIEASMNDEAFLQIMKLDVNYLTNLIVDTIESREDRAILIFYDGTVAEMHGDHVGSHRKLGPEVRHTNPHIYLSIVHFLSEFFDHKEISNLIIPKVLNEDEKRVLHEMKSHNIKELKIIFKEDKPPQIDVTEHEVITGEKAKDIKKALGLGNYERIELSTRDEKTLVFKKTKKT
jgi:hypothetical protein